MYLNGGPDNALLADGDYVFLVLAARGQSNPNGLGLLSLDSKDDRTFTVAGGSVQYGGGHATSTDTTTKQTLIQLQGQGAGNASWSGRFLVEKTASGACKRTFNWQVSKSVDKM